MQEKQMVIVSHLQREALLGEPSTAVERMLASKTARRSREASHA